MYSPGSSACLALLPLVIQINATYIYNPLQYDYQNYIYDLFYLHYNTRTILLILNILLVAYVFTRFVCLLPLVIQINATYIYTSLQCDLSELQL
jgi:hypothetical protein